MSVEVIDRPTVKPLDDPPTGPILEKWELRDEGHRYLTGYIYNDPARRFHDGEYIYTSELQWINEQAGLAQTRNTLYLLRGRASP
jgi:hypothetical protein